MMAEVVTKENIFADGRKGNGDESDMEDFVAGLSRQMAQSYLYEEDSNPKILMATTPQAALFGFGSSYCNPDGPSQMSSPLFTCFEPKRSEAGEVVRTSGLSRKPNRSECHPILNPVHIQQQLQLAKLLRLKRELLLRQHLAEVLRRQNGARSRSVGVGVGVGPGIGVSPSAWPRMQKPQRHPQTLSGSGTRPVFSNGSGMRKESTGTGVFLPRHIGTANEPKLKPACSNVPLSERVVQALNLDLDDLGVHSCVTNAPGNSMAYQQQNRGTVSSTNISSHEIRLPKEWTY